MEKTFRQRREILTELSLWSRARKVNKHGIKSKEIKEQWLGQWGAKGKKRQFHC